MKPGADTLVHDHPGRVEGSVDDGLDGWVNLRHGSPMPDPRRIQATVAQIVDLRKGPHAFSDLVANGVTRGQIRAAIDAGALMSLRRGVVMPSDLWDLGSLDERRLWAAQAALHAYPAGLASHETAARLHGLPDFRMPRDTGPVPVTHITRVGAARIDDWLTVHGCDTAPKWVTLRDGLRVTDLVRSSVEVAATRSQRGAVVLIDAAMRIAAQSEAPGREIREVVKDRTVVDMLRLRWRVAVGEIAGHRWVTRVREAVEFADPAAESVLESLSRYEIGATDLPQPQVGVRVRGDDDRYYWADLWWPGRRVIGEADGLGKYADPSTLLREKQRQLALEGAGYRFVRWEWEHVYPHPGVMLGRIRQALSQPPTRPGWS